MPAADSGKLSRIRCDLSLRKAFIALIAASLVTFAVLSLVYVNIVDPERFPFLRIPVLPKSGASEALPIQSIPPEDRTPEQIELSVVNQYEYNKYLATLENPVSEFAVCTNPFHTNESATVLVSENGPEGTLARVEFSWYGWDTPNRFNPSILPYPPNSPNPYFAIARQSVMKKRPGSDKEEQYNELVYCDMDWGLSKGIGRRILTCKTDTKILNSLPEWRSPNNSCTWRSFLHGMNGYTDPRVFFSPAGEPLMIVGNNGKTNCLSQYIVDLRVLIPELDEKMSVQHVPIRYGEISELPRDKLDEVEKNWFLLYDEANTAYVQHDLMNRSIATLDMADDATNIAAGMTAPACITSLVKHYDEPSKDINNAVHQGTNSLRVTLCEYPCIPTVFNTVLIEMFNIKYHSFVEVFYRRYIVVMNVTAPFNVIARTNNLIYAGSDEKMLIFTVSMAWDHNFRHRAEWDESKFGGRKVWEAMEDQEVDEVENRITEFEDDFGGHERISISRRKTDDQEQPEVVSLEDAQKKYPSLQEVEAVANGTTYRNPLINAYHGWLDDTIMLSIGINDKESGVVHVKAHSLLDCLSVCS